MGPCRIKTGAFLVIVHAALLMLLAPAAVPVAPAGTSFKAVVIGGYDCPEYNDDVDSAASRLQALGISTVKIKSCNIIGASHQGSGWSIVQPEIANADIILYFGHGGGNDHPEFDQDNYWGFWLDYDYSFSPAPNPNQDPRLGMISRGVIKSEVALKPNALVGLGHACYSAGSSSTDSLDGVPASTAYLRADNYSDTFLEHSDAKAYLSSGAEGGIVDMVESMARGSTLGEAFSRRVNDGVPRVNYTYAYPPVPGGSLMQSGMITGYANPWWTDAVAGDMNTTIQDILPGYVPPSTAGAVELSPSTSTPQNAFSTFLLTENPSDQTAMVTHYLMAEGDPQLYKISRSVPAHSRDTVWLNQYLPGKSVSVHTTSLGFMDTAPLPVICERSMYFNSSRRTGGSNASGLQGPANTWYFAEGYTAGSFDCWFLVQNPGDSALDATLSFSRADGVPVQPVNAHLPAKSRTTVHADDLPGLEGTEFSTTVSATGTGVIAERAEYFDYNGIDGGHGQPGFTSPGKTFYFAEGYTAERFDTYVLLFNPGQQPAAASLELCDTEGRREFFPVAVPPGRRHTVRLDDLVGTYRWDAAQVSAKVTSDVEIFAERAMYFDYNGMTGGSDVRGVPSPAATWYMAEGCTASPFDTWFLLANPGDADVTVRMAFQRGDGAPVADHLETVPAHSRRSIRACYIPGIESTSFSTSITSTGGSVVAERAMYFDWQGKDGGHANPGVTGAASDWFFAEGYTGD